MRLFTFSRYLVYSLKSNTNSELQTFKIFKAHQSWRHEIYQMHGKGEVNDFPLFILYFKVGGTMPLLRGMSFCPAYAFIITTICAAIFVINKEKKT